VDAPLAPRAVLVQGLGVAAAVGAIAEAVRTTLGASAAFDPSTEGFWIRVGVGAIGFAVLLVSGVPLTLSIVDDRTRRTRTGVIVERVVADDAGRTRHYLLVDHGDGRETPYEVRAEMFASTAGPGPVRMVVSGLTRHVFALEPIDDGATTTTDAAGGAARGIRSRVRASR